MNMNEKSFTYTITDVPENFDKIPAGNYADDELDISLTINQKIEYGKSEIKLSVLITKCPNMIPFWAALYVQIQDQETKYFISIEKKKKKNQKSFETPFTSDIFTNGTVITYKIKQIPSYTCGLKNDGCVCYLNCALQLLFHLSKFRETLRFSFVQDENSNWEKKLKELFEKMCTYRPYLETEELTESFGWPSLARKIPQDASEFIEILLNKIADSNVNWKKRIDTIFSSTYISPEKQEITKYIIDLPPVKSDETFMQKLEECIGNTKLLTFPEVLLINLCKYGFDPDKLEKKLDLSKLGNNQNAQHKKYTLSGIIYLIQKNSGIDHYTCFVRASTEEIWLYFSDSTEITYSWKYKRSINKVISPLDYEIPSKFTNNGKISFLMYIADDVINDYFIYSHAPPPFSNSIDTNFDSKTRRISISTNDDIEKYIQSGHTDFEGVESSLSFDISADLPYSAVYEKVSKEFNVPIDSFILRTEKEGRAPSFHEFPKSKSTLKNFYKYEIHLYYEEKKEKRTSLSQYIPFYFVLFHFNATTYYHNIFVNLTRPDLQNLQKSMPVQRIKGKIQRHPSNSIMRNNDESESNTNKYKEKHSFKYLTSKTLCTTSNFGSVTDDLLRIINEKDEQKKHTKITLFIAEYLNEGDKEKIGYKKIDPTKNIRDYKILEGTFIYVQCDDDFLEENDTPAVQQIIQPKFLFFKYMNQIYKDKIYPKQIPYVLMMEKYAVPVTFCKLSDPVNTKKTMLFPMKANIKNVTELKKIICVAMGEKYPEKGLMQLFFGFRTELWPPFHDQIKDDKDISFVTSILNTSLENSTVFQYTLNLSASSSSQSLLDKQDQPEEEIKTDKSYASNIFIHYHIFEEFTLKKEISVRAYFSKDAITIDCISQIKVPVDSKISDVILKLREAFGDQLDEEDKQNLIKFEQNDPNFNFKDVYRILQISNGKISREADFHFTISSSYEIRVERIQKVIDIELPTKKVIHFTINDIQCYIPVFYGARYNSKNEPRFNSCYIGSVGTPFYFPVLKSDLTDPNLSNDGKFRYSAFYKRLKSMITEKEIKFTLFVTNYFGMIQKVKVNEIETIIKRNLNYSICINDLNASTFIDVYQFFKDNIRILT